jgi:hypothetical protein
LCAAIAERCSSLGASDAVIVLSDGGKLGGRSRVAMRVHFLPRVQPSSPLWQHSTEQAQHAVIGNGKNRGEAHLRRCVSLPVRCGRLLGIGSLLGGTLARQHRRRRRRVMCEVVPARSIKGIGG